MLVISMFVRRVHPRAFDERQSLASLVLSQSVALGRFYRRVFSAASTLSAGRQLMTSSRVSQPLRTVPVIYYLAERQRHATANRAATTA